MSGVIRQLTPKEFPTLLTEIPDAPKKLYLRGSLPHEGLKVLCVVGSRQYSTYGKMMSEKLIAGLRGYDISIVSGLALGIDSVAHRAALKAGLYTLAIPGSGLNDEVLYPRAHVGLAKDILDSGGGLLSEFEPTQPAAPYTFPQRNRIMAGMSHAILIIEAQQKSGTLITARLALEYNRDVLAVPGDVTTMNSYGPHMLIRDGAALIRDSDDIVAALQIPLQSRSALDTNNLSDTEKTVLAFLSEPKERDEIIQKMGLPPENVNVLLAAMELKGFIEERLGKICRM